MSLLGGKNWGKVSNYKGQFVSDESDEGQATSKVKSPDSPQEVFAAGAALVGLDEIGATVGVVGAELVAGASFNDDAPFSIVMVTVTKVGAGGEVSPRIIFGA